MPRARSSPTEPVGTTGISSWSDSPSLRRMMAPLPNSFSTPAMASSRALLRFLSSMARRLLSPRILRTRSARKMDVKRGVIVFLSLAIPSACEERSSRRDAERPLLPAPWGDDASVEPIGPAVRRELEQIEAEAGIELAVDPSPPSGDLKSDIESFTTLDACVRARAMADPLLGDAIEALGYDTLMRDACRIL